MYKLETKLVENIPQEELEGPYVGRNDGQKIRHTALDATRCHPEGLYGMFQVNLTFEYAFETELTLAYRRSVNNLIFALETNIHTDSDPKL
jgi:hypothetical protein